MDQKNSTEASFRSTLEDLLLVATKLSPYCQQTSDLVGMVQLAIDNDGQLKLLIKLVTEHGGRK